MGFKITKDMSFVEVMKILPQSVEIFRVYNLDCSDCQLAEYENLEQGCHIHGVDVEALLEDLNRALS